MRIPTGTHVLVADGGKMLLFRNGGTAFEPNLDLVASKTQDNPRDSEQRRDQRGRMPDHGSPGMSSVSEVDYHQQAEDEFAIKTAEWINAQVLGGEMDALIVVAAARFLGVLRCNWHKETAGRIKAEIDKAMTGHPVDAIVKMLVDLEEPG